MKKITAIFIALVVGVLLTLASANTSAARPSHSPLPNDYSLAIDSGWYDAGEGFTPYFHFDPNGIDGYWALRVRAKCDATGPNNLWATEKVVVWIQRYEAYDPPLQDTYAFTNWQQTDPLYDQTDVPGVITEDFYFHTPNYTQMINGHYPIRMRGGANPSGSSDGNHADKCHLGFQIYNRTS